MVGWSCIPSLLFTCDQTTVEVMKIMVTSSKGPMYRLLHSVLPTLQQATADPRLCWRLLDTHRQVWVSLLWGHCSFLLGPGAHKVLFMPSLQESVSQSCVSSGGSMAELKAKELQKNIYFCFIDYAKVFDCVNHNKL